MLEDLAILTGGSVISEDSASSLENVKISDLGRAKKITVDKDNTPSLRARARPTRSRDG